MSENTAQQISKSRGEWLEKIDHAKAIAINVDKSVESEKTICTFEDGSKLMFSIPIAN